MDVACSHDTSKRPGSSGRLQSQHAKTTSRLLEAIDTPHDLRKLPESRLPQLAGELRQFLIDSVMQSGGHFAAGLGAIELTIALHYVFNTPDDQLVWDVGHQTYPHKILTDRRELLHAIRQQDGLSGFPRRVESHYDTFGVGHAGTSISAAAGMAIAEQQLGRNHKVVSIIGDGAMTAGLAMEALNHAGDRGLDLIVVLNDNNMSISPNVGALSRHLTELLTQSPDTNTLSKGRPAFTHLQQPKGLVCGLEKPVNGSRRPSSLFEKIGFEYFGPVDGHDTQSLVDTLSSLADMPGPRLLHVVTCKGKGYAPAESDPVAFHSVSASASSRQAAKQPVGPTYTQIFGDWLCQMATQDPRLVGITPAMREGSGMVNFCKQFPQRYFDVGIAEQHAVTLAAGLACGGLKPVVAIYSTFLQRAYDQLIHDVAIQNLPVLFALDRAGIVGPDGPTHTGNFDLSYLRCIPNLVVMAPADENECRNMLTTGYHLDQPVAVRYPRGRGPGVAVSETPELLPIGKAQLRRTGKKTALLAFGASLQPALEAAESLDATVINMRFVKPLDTAMIINIAASHELLISVEDNTVAGGAGSAINECLAAHQVLTPILNLGLPDQFPEHGKRDHILARAGLDAQGLTNTVNHYWNQAN